MSCAACDLWRCHRSRQRVTTTIASAEEDSETVEKRSLGVNSFLWRGHCLTFSRSSRVQNSNWSTPTACETPNWMTEIWNTDSQSEIHLNGRARNSSWGHTYWYPGTVRVIGQNGTSPRLHDLSTRQNGPQPTLGANTRRNLNQTTLYTCSKKTRDLNQTALDLVHETCETRREKMNGREKEDHEWTRKWIGRS